MVVNDKLISGGEPKIIKIRPVISKKNYFILPDGTTNEASYIQIYYIIYYISDFNKTTQHLILVNIFLFQSKKIFQHTLRIMPKLSCR